MNSRTLEKMRRKENRMEYFDIKGKQLSKFQLGTVQLGMKYGLGKDSDKPSEETAFAMLDEAMKLGVNNIDTANNYGDSQKVIGHWLKKRKQEGEAVPYVITKIGPLKHGSYEILYDDVMAQVEGCKKELGMDTLDMLMLHDFEDYEQDRDPLRKIFEILKENGEISESAISAYSRHDYAVIAESGFDATQIPLNVFDWTRIDDGGIQKIAEAGMKIFARSTFLQGLVFHTPDDLDPRMSFCIPTVEKWNRLCEEFRMEPSVLAMSFILSVPGITCAVLGCDTVHHVEANCEMMNKTVRLEDGQMEILHNAFRDTRADVLNPGVWFNHT